MTLYVAALPRWIQFCLSGYPAGLTEPVRCGEATFLVYR